MAYNTAKVATGGAGNDVINGTADADTLSGAAGNDTLNGLGGNDVLEGGAGNDRINGGLGVDTATYQNASGRVVVDLNLQSSDGSVVQNTGGAGSDRLSGIENLTGSEGFGDQLIGDGARNVIRGGGGGDDLRGNGGNDAVYGGLGNDFVSGGSGNDWLDGGSGRDTASYLNATARVSVDLGITGPQNTVGAGVDTLVSVENVDGSRGFGDELQGNDGANVIRGFGGNDEIEGDEGADTLFGGAGADTFVYGNDNDSLASARDFIADYQADDILDLSGIDATDGDDDRGGSGSGGGDGDAFVRIANGAAFTEAGQMRLTLDGNRTLVELNTDDDAQAESIIMLAGNWTSATAEDGWIL